MSYPAIKGCEKVSERKTTDDDDEELEVIPAGKIKCFITGKLRKDTPEERIRQDVARSLVEEYGYEKSDIEVEFSVKMGRARKRADIVIFYEKKAHTQENAYIIIEVKTEKVKPSDRKEGINQLKTYVAACLNCSFALWVGNERLAFKIIKVKGKRDIEEISDIPKRGETTAPRYTKGTLVPAVELKQVFKRTHNYIYANQGLQKDKAFEELQKLIFIKVYDEQYSPRLQFYISDDEETSDLRERLTEVFKKVQSRYKYIFKGDEKIELNDTILRYIAKELQRFSLVETETDIKGEAYEEIVGPNLRGDRGEFFTARNVCKMTIGMLFSLFPEEKVTSPGALKLLDPAVGTGGFLIASVQKIKQLTEKRGFKYDRLRDLVREVSNTNLFGIDFNPFLVKVAQMNMVMHGDGSANIFQTNSLENPSNWRDDVKNAIKFEEFDIVVTNPPFGTQALIDNTDILDQYELTKIDAKSPRTSLPPEQLFIERCLDFLKPGGFLGIVLPDSILSNPGLTWIRKWILKKTYMIASVDLPGETFEPHTGTQTSILILKKKKTEQEKITEDYEAFMALPEKVGHDRRGNPLIKTTPDGKRILDTNNNPVLDDHLPIVTQKFEEWVRRKGMA